VHVTLVHWNQPVRCQKTVAAFRAQTEPVDITIVDNGSRPADLVRLRELVPDVPIVEQGRNTGFGPAANAGWRVGLGDPANEYVVVAPHDALPEADCLERILAELDGRPDAGLACADVGDGEVPVIDHYFGGLTLPSSQTEGWEDVAYPHGTLMVARRACLLDIGLFDERYFAYCEEADLGLRAQRAGWGIGLVHGARVVNPTMRSGSDAVDYLMQRNTLHLVRRYWGRWHAFMRFVIALIELVRAHFGWGPDPFIYAPKGRILGLLAFLRGETGPPPTRLFERLDADGDPC
jgi:GT2 family glycosyltransferase